MLLVTLLLAACGPAGEKAAWLGTIDTLPGGAIVVSNPAAGVWDSATGWKLNEELVIGDGDTDTTALLSDVAALEVDSAGRIYVLDRQRSAVTVFDHQGGFVRKFGREGDGPGEFRGPNGLDWDNQGRLWVVEGPSWRYSVFDGEGNFIQTSRRVVGSYGWAWTGKFLHDGSLMEHVSKRESETRSQPYVARLDTTTQSMVDSLPLPFAHTGDNFFDFRNKDGIGTIMGIPFSPSYWSVIDPRGFLWLGRNDAYELTEIDLQGDTVRVIRKEHTAIPIEAAERDSALEHIRKIAQGAEFDEGRIPRLKPVLDRVLVSDSGYVWVMTVEPAGTSGTRFDVFDPEGRYLGRVTTPRRVGPWRPAAPMVLRRGKVWAVVVDEDDVPQVVRWGLTSPPAPSP